MNFGDELIAKIWLDFLTTALPFEEIWVDTCNPGVSSIIFRNYTNVKFTDTLWTASRNSIGKNLDYVFGLEFCKDGGVAFSNGLELIKAARYVHLVGGGYLNSEFSFNYALISILSKLKRESGFQIIGTGLGLEPIDYSYEYIVGQFFQSFSWIDVRDEQSYKRLISWGLKEKSSYTCDDVFFSPILSSEAIRPGKLVISAQPSDKPSLMISFLIKLIENCPNSRNGVEFLTMDAISDMTVIKKVIDVCGSDNISVRSFNDLWKDGLPIIPDDFVFSTRFHAHLVASMMGARGLCASVSIPYYDVKHLSLIEMGSGFDIIGIHDFSFMYQWDKKTNTLKEKVEILQEKKNSIINKFYGMK